jgi:anthranilate phosphoribosyltransferase
MNTVLANAAFGIQTIEQEKPIGECLEIAKDALYGKKALYVLEKFTEINQ